MKNYVLYIAKNNDSYTRTVSFLMMVFVVIMFILISIIVRKKPLNQVEGIVNSIEKMQVQRKNNSSFDLKQNYHSEEVINIQLNREIYFVETNFKSKWNNVLKEIHEGDKILIDYIITDEGKRICQLEKNSIIILNYKELLKIEFYIKIVLTILSVITLSYVFLLYYLRKKY